MGQPFVRVDVWTLNVDDPIITAYAGAVAAMKAKSAADATDPTGWLYQANIHGTLDGSPLPQWNQCRHGGWFFASWHRMYLYFFERIVRAQVIANGGPSDWALPYWDYDGGGTDNTLPLAFRNPTLADGTDNPLFAARDPSINAGAGLPSSITSPAFALGRPMFTGTSQFGGGVTPAPGQFFSQTGRLEQTPHNDVHVAVGGQNGLMVDPDTAAQDPIFWLHHANIDRLWWLWRQQAPHTDPTTNAAWKTPSFDFVDVGGGAASLTSADVEDIAQLGYTYVAAAAPPSFAVTPSATMTPRAKWPWPWPQPAPTPGVSFGAPGAQAEAAGEPARQLVGATDKPVQLTGSAVQVPITIDERATQAASFDVGEGGPQGRAFLDIEDVDAARTPGTVYGVYVNLPDKPTAADLAAHHVGNVSLFGVVRARNPRGDEHAHGLRISMEITDLLDRLAAAGTWTQGTQLNVTFRPIALEPPPGAVDFATPAAQTAHPDLPITIGRVSVHMA